MADCAEKDKVPEIEPSPLSPKSTLLTTRPPTTAANLLPSKQTGKKLYAVKHDILFPQVIFPSTLRFHSIEQKMIPGAATSDHPTQLRYNF